MNKNNRCALVSGASGIVGYGILRCLSGSGYKLIGTTIYDESPADCFSDEVKHPPVTTSEDYMPWLLDTIKNEKISILFPGIELDMEIWNKNRECIIGAGAFPVLNRAELVELCLDKWNFFKRLQDSNCEFRIDTSYTPDYFRFDKPFIVKPRNGFGSRGFRIIHNVDEYDECKDQIGKSLIMQEYVGSAEEEYTVAAFFDKNSVIKAHISLKRKLSKQGFTEIAEVVNIADEITPILRQLSELLKPVGPTDFQFRKTGNGWKLLEINPRISSSTSIRKAFGYNEAQMCIDYFINGIEIRQPKIRYGKATRYTEDYILL